MGSAIGAILGIAVGVAMSPFPVVAVILMLFTPKARASSVLFLTGWVVGLAGVGAVVLLADVTSAEGGGESDGSGWLKLALGLLLLVLGWRNWTGRPRAGDEPAVPKWMDAIDRFTPAKAFGLAVLLSAVNPKNLALTVAAAASIAAAGLSTAQEIVTLAIFVAIGSASVALPVVVSLVRGHRADATLNVWKDWLVTNNATVMAVLLVLLGVKLVGDAVTILA